MYVSVKMIVFTIQRHVDVDVLPLTLYLPFPAQTYMVEFRRSRPGRVHSQLAP
jgi:hypothetical protein